ncbi:TetR/AcrR family transcriptional regulator [Metabacillus idriensis]|uniref:TetR/AcrR family transcriptional regulator n=1 Tax=Metabacillus idriensis TaxID=324768 RepID=UPI001CD54F48|nr:TetR/AcrR family transcriptional regulator [Metabacillus idriensis]
MDKKAIHTIRMMGFFIDATAQIIEEEGIENVSIRRVSDLAGYNSSTIYNYFGDLTVLIFFASMKIFKKYTDALPEYMAKGKNPLEKYLLHWECFCDYSFKEPQIFHAIFSSDIGGNHEKLMNEYYDLFPNDLDTLPNDIKHLMLERNLTNRDRIALQKCVEAGYIKEENTEHITQMTKMIWMGMHNMVLNNRYAYSPEEASKITMKYVKEIIKLANVFDFQ